MTARRFDFGAHHRRSATRRGPGGGGGASRCALFGVWLTLLAGCATVTFKRGASPDAMAADERACRNAGTDEAAFVECMRNRGWFVHEINRVGDGTSTDARVTEPRAPGAGSAVAAGDEVARRAPGAAPAPKGTGPPSATAAGPPAGTADPLARINVASWWKLGGSAADLDRAIDKCVGELGTAHRPNPGATVVTAGLRACLRAADWYAVGVSASR